MTKGPRKIKTSVSNNRLPTFAYWLISITCLATLAAAAINTNKEHHICLTSCNGTCSCSQNYTFQCQDGITCISLTKYRNGIKDCPDGSDEECCQNSAFQCDQYGNSTKCLGRNKINDGIVDCADQSDEDSSAALTCIQLRKTSQVYQCRTQLLGPKTGVCILTSQVLDGSKQCPLGDDENTGLFDICQLRRPVCPANATCQSANNGRSFSCVCKTGFIGFGNKCTAV